MTAASRRGAMLALSVIVDGPKKARAGLWQRGTAAMRHLVLLAALLVAMLAPTLLVVRMAGSGDAGALLSVAMLEQRLREQPMSLLGRTVRVRGVASEECVDPAHRVAGCTAWRLQLFDAAPDGDAAITLVPEPMSPYLATFRRWSLLAALLPAPQSPLLERPAAYKITTRRAACAGGERAPCYVATLIDARE